VSVVPAVGQGRRRSAITRKHRKVFLERLAAGFSVAAASAPTGKGRQRFYEERAVDPAFAEAWRHAWEAGQDVIEDELLRAATEGWEEVDEVYEGGELVRRIVRQRKNPALLAKLERKRQPEKSPLVEVNVQPALARPVEWSDIAGMLRDTGQMHLIGSFHPTLVRAVLPELAPAELEAVVAEVVDIEPGADVDPDSSESLNPLPVQARARTLGDAGLPP
jgi:hypothetical protein